VSGLDFGRDDLSDFELLRLWSQRLCDLPDELHPDWANRWRLSSCRSMPNPVGPLTAPLLRVLLPRLGRLPSITSLRLIHLAPCLVSSEEAHLMLARLALKLRPKVWQMAISGPVRARLLRICSPSTTGDLTLANSRAFHPRLLQLEPSDWSCLGLRDWRHMLPASAVAAFRVVRWTLPRTDCSALCSACGDAPFVQLSRSQLQDCFLDLRHDV
jgi:hypothetical protein